jgi:hypothetical protein
MRKLKWFFRLVWQPFHERRISVREAWELARMLA